MSVFTELLRRDIESLLSQYTLGQYHSHQGIQAGTENTNYFVDTNLAQFVLTLFEKHQPAELPFFLSLGEHLHDHQCAVPQPFRTASGDFLAEVKGKPAVIFERVPGKHHQASPLHAQKLAGALGDIHINTAQFTEYRAHSHDLNWIRQTAEHLLPFMDKAESQLLTQALSALDNLPIGQLPAGIIHADLFHDNALFVEDQLSGIIDWYFAGHDAYSLDIAICLIDWCLDDQGQPDPTRCADFVGAYHHRRPLQLEEVDALPLLMVQAATRFWLSRALALTRHNSSGNIQLKDPTPMQQIVLFCLQNQRSLSEAFKHQLK